jgi:hypothetical protein
MLFTETNSNRCSEYESQKKKILRISIHLVSCENSRKEKFYFNFFITDAKNKDMVVDKRCIVNKIGEFRIR